MAMRSPIRVTVAGTVLALAASGCTSAPATGAGPGPVTTVDAVAAMSAVGASAGAPRLAATVPAAATSPLASTPRAAGRLTQAVDTGAGELFIESAWDAEDARNRVTVPHTGKLQRGPVPGELLRLPAFKGASSAVRLAQWYLVPGTPDSALAFIKAHSIDGFVRRPAAGSPAHGEAGYTFTAHTNAPPNSSITESVAVVHGRTALLVQANGTWRSSGGRPRSVPMGLSAATLTRGNGATNPQALYGQALYGILGALDAATPSAAAAPTCATRTTVPVTLTLTFLRASIVVRQAAHSCGLITVTVDGLAEARPSLVAPALAAAVSRAIASSAQPAPFPAPSSAVHSAAAAKALGRRIVALAKLPAHASTVSAPPRGLDVSDAGTATAHVVEVTRFWLVPDSTTDVDAYLGSLTVPHFTATDEGIGSPSGIRTADYVLTGVPSDQGASLSLEWLQQTGGRMGVRVDVLVPWTAPQG